MNLLETRKRIMMGESIYDLPLRVTFYARVSTDKDAQINSLKNQISYYTEFIKSITNWVYVEGYIDEGISGTSVEKRENFLRMIDDSSDDKFDLILTKEISRFSRNTLDSIKFTQELLANNVGVLFQTDNINTILPDSELRLTIMSSIAQEEVRKLSERVKFGFKRSIDKCRVLGNSSIIGYNKKDGKMTINEDEAIIVKTIFEMYSTGKYGLKAISTYLYEHGYTNRNGGLFPNSTIRGIILNPKYKGYYCSNKYKHIDFKSKKRINVDKENWIIKKDTSGNVPAIVSEYLWDRANEILNNKTCGYLKKIKNKDCFKVTTTYGGKLFCSLHNKPFRRHIDYRSKRHIWICDELHKKGISACKSAIIYEDELDNLFKNFINSLFNDKDSIINHLYNLYLNNSISNYYKNEKDKINSKNKDLLLRKNKIMDLLINGVINKEDYYNKINELNIELENCNKLFNKLLIEESNDNDVINNTSKLKEEIEFELYIDNIYSDLFRLIVDKVIVYKINEDRHNIKYEIYLNYFNKKVELYNYETLTMF